MSKNANGEGSIFSLKNGKYRAELTIGWKEGKREYLRKTFDKRKDAAKQLTDWLKDRDEGRLIKPTKETLGSFFDEWLGSLLNIEPSTEDQYKTYFDWYVRPTLGDVKLSDLAPEQFQTLYKDLLQTGGKKQQGLSPRTVRLVHASLHAALEQAVVWNRLSVNPVGVKKVKLPKDPIKDLTPLDSNELAKFLKAIRTERLHALFLLAVTTGLRRGELLGLRWEDINFASGMITVKQQVRLVKNKRNINSPKTEGSKRTVPVPSFVLDDLRKWQVELEAEIAALGAENWANPELVFPSHIGTPYNPHNWYKRDFLPLFAKAGIRRIRPHDMRHTAGTMMLANGVDIRTVQEILGHTNIRMTQRYTHSLSEHKEKAARQVDSYLAAIMEGEPASQTEKPPVH